MPTEVARETTMARLSREQRRAQLLDVGREMLGTVTLDRVSTDEVADRAGISRGLLFHYFPTKHDFLVALATSFADDLLAATAPADVDDPVARLRDGLERYLAFMRANQRAYQSLVRGAAGGREDMLGLFERTRDEQARRLLEGVGIDPAAARSRDRYAVRGYIALVEEVTMLWLREGDEDTDAVVDLALQLAVALLDQLTEAPA